jgi:hypothetical protein
MFSVRKAVAAILALATAGLLIGAVVVRGEPAAAADNQPWEVKGKLLGQPKADTLDSKKSSDVSGIACATVTGSRRICLVADDETQGVQIAILKNDSMIAGDFIRLIDNVHDGKLIELDAEGVAYADDSFYVIGSHGRPRHKDDPEARVKADAKAEASRQVFRVRFDLNAVDDEGRLSGAVEIKRSTKLAEFIKQEPRLKSSFDRALENNGLAIEGVAVRDGKMYSGMRGPLLDGNHAAILSVPLAALFDGQKGDAHLDPVDLEGRGIRDLVAFETGFLVLAGPVNDPPDPGEIKGGDYLVYWWDGNTRVTRLNHPPLAFGNKIKPEALLPIDRRDNKLRVLLFFDGPDEGAPRMVEIDQP